MTLTLDVKFNTNTVDLLTAVSKQMAQPINTDSSLVLETYNTLGLERRLRRFEITRQILNSWDRDTQNTLIILPDSFDESDRDLEFANVDKSEKSPGGFVLQLHHSQRPGKWNKRFVTLLESGQVFSSKKANPSPADKDVQNLCHLSDFDIYTPTEAQMRKQLKPPKKYCYAIKSQQKTNVFENTENFVHFFCTEDRDVAQLFHSAVHGWRSWYLAQRVLEMQRKMEADRPPQIVTVKHKPKKSISHVKVNGHKLKVSVDEAPYNIGEFQPLLDLHRFNKPLDEFGKDWELDQARRSAMMLQGLNASDAAAVAVASNGNKSAFAANGLLGDGYDERKQVAREVQRKKATAGDLNGAEGPFTDGPNLLNGGITASPVTMKPEEGSNNGESLEVRPLAIPGAQAATPSPTDNDTAASQEVDKSSSSWFPSASDHSARLRSLSNVRPPQQPSLTRLSTTDNDIRDRRNIRDRSGDRPHPLQQQQQQQQHHPSQQQQRRGGGPMRKGPPSPLVDLTPKFQEAPQWARDGKGRGVAVPEGMMLVDMATGPSPLSPNMGRFLEVPPRNLIRRDNRDNRDARDTRGPSGTSESAMAAHVAGLSLPKRPSTSDGERPHATGRSRSHTGGATMMSQAGSVRRGVSSGHQGSHGNDGYSTRPPVPPLPLTTSRSGGSAQHGFPLPPKPRTTGTSANRPGSSKGPHHRQQHHDSEGSLRGRDPEPRELARGMMGRPGASVAVGGGRH
jgi:hypothetical protein